MHGSHHGVVERLGHRVSSKPMARGGRLVSENRELTRRRLEAGELQLAVERRACVRVGRPRSFVAAREDVANLRSAHGLLHEHKPPWLAVANRGREPSETRSEEHTSELQSRLHLVCRLLLEKKKTT